jgi:hypothetical protein
VLACAALALGFAFTEADFALEAAAFDLVPPDLLFEADFALELSNLF